jgi:hypothetical protein
MKAIIIDDAYGRPNPDDLRLSINSLRKFLTDVPAAKDWFDQQFGLQGSARARGYLTPLLNNGQLIQTLWRRKAECPEPDRLLVEGLADMAAEIEPLRLPLVHIESALSNGWELERHASLPAVEALPVDLDLIVIDYVLTPNTAVDLVNKVAESTAFLSKVFDRFAKLEKPSNQPLIVLVSSQPGVERQQAEDFRKSVGIQGAFFQFIGKASLQTDFHPRVTGFLQESKELQSYRKVHLALHSSLISASKQLLDDIEKLELQDLAALQVGHLVNEGEALSDYLGWMLGQVLSVKLQQDVNLANTSRDLPQESHRVLLGHLQPSQAIPRLFSELSSVRSAFSEFQKQKDGERTLRFGDIFAAVNSDGIVDVRRFALVISQTCDLLQEKITNGQVLCVEGVAIEVGASEAELMRATLHQLDNKGATLIKLDEKYYQLEWNDANLCTFPQSRMKGEKGYRYIGRLNEIYALEAQHNALNRVGRIGVPIKPGYGTVFGALRIRVWSAKNELVGLLRMFDTKTVVAVLRATPNKQVHILLAGPVKQWLREQFVALKNEGEFLKELTDVADELIGCLGEENDFHFICKQSKQAKSLQLCRTKVGVDPRTHQPKTETVSINKLSVNLGDVEIFKDVAPPAGLRIQLEFDPIR